jgi:transcriptional regulator with XRE-family HTH domain
LATIPDYQQIFRTSFATRLINKLREKGFISRRGTNGVNGKQLATAAGVSLPMARRYINAQSIPENSTLQKISNWLNVDPFWLLYGENNISHDKSHLLNKELFKEIFEQMFPLLCNTNITKEQYTALITACLDIYSNISTIDGTDKPKSNAISLMVDFIKKNI